MLIFVLRHADRDPMADKLSTIGGKRATFLAHMLSESGVYQAYCSDAHRTRDTLAPMKHLLGGELSITEFSAAPPHGPEGHVQSVIAAVKALPEAAVAVVVSHSNTVGPIIHGLGGGTIAPIGDSEFDRLFVLFSLPNGNRILLKLRY